MSTVFWDNSSSGAIRGLVGGVQTTTTFGDVIGPGAEGPLHAPNYWDQCVLHGELIPGLVKVLVPSRPRRLQQNKTKGHNGAMPIFVGMEPARVGINIVIWTPDQLKEMDRILPIIFPLPNKNINNLASLPISHPATSQRGINAIIVEDISGPDPGPVPGSMQYSLKCVEHLPINIHKRASKVVTQAPPIKAQFDQNTKVAKNNPAKPSQSGAFNPTAAPTPAQGGS